MGGRGTKKEKESPYIKESRNGAERKKQSQYMKIRVKRVKPWLFKSEGPSIEWGAGVAGRYRWKCNFRKKVLTSMVSENKKFYARLIFRLDEATFNRRGEF